MNEVILGIDLGTTQSAVGVVESGFPILLADEQGETLTPSAVWYGDKGDMAVGAAAMRRSGVTPVVTSIKALIGRRIEEVDGRAGISEKEDRLFVETDAGLKSPEEISSEILKHLKKIAENRLKQEVAKAVITVPAYFNDAQRTATKKAGEIAGLEVIRILSEPTAAALSYGLDRLDEAARVAVFDLGGGTFDVSILEMREGVFEVLATAGDTRLGGDDFDDLIMNHSLMELGVPEKSLSIVDQARWQKEARRVKQILSSEEQVILRIPFSGEVEWTRAKFETLLKPFLDRMEGCCHKALLDAKVKISDLRNILMVGGSSRIPIVRERVRQVFEKEPDLSQHPDEAIARGASIQAGDLSGAVREVVLLDVTPLSLGIETMGGLMNVLIPRNTTIPCKAGEMFTNAVDYQNSMKVRVLQGERELAGDNWALGEFEVSFNAARKGQARVGVEFQIDADGILSVLARDTATGNDITIKVGSAAVDVTEAKVEKMVSESVEFAFEDMNARVFEEARLKAEELLPSVKLALDQAGAFLTNDELSVIKHIQEEVQLALDQKETSRLKQLVEKLDEATESLAALLLEKATQKFFSSS